MRIEILPTAPSIPVRLTRMALAVLRALVPQWMLHDDIAMPRHRRMGAWETHASVSAREAVVKVREQERL